MKCIIDDPNFAFSRINLAEKEMTPSQIVSFREKIIQRINSFFKWSKYDKKYRHLVYYVELDGEAYFYANGYLMTEEEFEEDVATRKGVGYVGAFHRR